MEETRVHHSLAWGIVLVGVLLAVATVYWFLSEVNTVTAASVTKDALTGVVLAAGERQQIERWIGQNDLNEYGDLPGTKYAIDPQVDFYTGEVLTDRHILIVRKYPKRPWRKMRRNDKILNS